MKHDSMFFNYMISSVHQQIHWNCPLIQLFFILQTHSKFQHTSKIRKKERTHNEIHYSTELRDYAKYNIPTITS